jgi:hypothetical protein
MTKGNDRGKSVKVRSTRTQPGPKVQTAMKAGGLGPGQHSRRTYGAAPPGGASSACVEREWPVNFSRRALR